MNQQSANFLMRIHNEAKQEVLKNIEKKLLVKKDFEGLSRLKRMQEETEEVLLRLEEQKNHKDSKRKNLMNVSNERQNSPLITSSLSVQNKLNKRSENDYTN